MAEVETRGSGALSRRIIFALALIQIPLAPLLPAASDALLAQIRDLNAAVSEAVRSGNPPDIGALNSLLSQRQGLVGELIKEDPKSVRSVALDANSADRVRAGAPAAASRIEQPGEWTGTLEVVAEMDFKNHKAWTHRFLRTPAGRVELFGDARTFRGLDSRGGASLRVRGIRASARIAVDTITATTPAAGLVLSPLGVENYAVLIVNDAANPSLPSSWTAAAIQNLFFGTSGLTLNTYWQEASYGQTSATGTVFGPFTLPRNYSCSDGDESDSDTLRQAAISAAGGSVNFSQFNRVAILFPSNSCAYGGLATIGGASYTDLPNVTSIAWFPVETFQTPSGYLGVVSHEAGHNIGLNHANSEDFGPVPLGQPGTDGINTEYGDPFSAMDAGDLPGANASPSQYSAQHKVSVLKWLGPADYEQVTTAGDYSVLPLEDTSGTRGLRILRDPVTQSWLWIESRQAIGQFDSTLSTEKGSNALSGLLVHFENPDLDPLHTYLIDFNAIASPNNFDTSAMTPGQKWTDPYSMLNLTVNGIGANGSTVTVGYDTPCATLSASGTVVSQSGGAGSIQVTAPPDCSWTASTSDSWIALSASGGTGNGTVGFTAAQNSSGDQRNGVVTVQRQSVPILQEGPGISGITTPTISGSGRSASFTFQFADSSGASDIEYIYGEVGDSGSCTFEAVPSDPGYIWLLNDAGTKFLGPLFVGQGASVSNSTCTILGNGSSMSASGDVVKATVNVLFASSVNSEFGIYALAFSSNQQDWSDTFTFGDWFASSLQQTSVTLASALNPAQAGQSVTLTASVTPATATGTVAFRDGAIVLGSGALTAGNAALTTASLAGGLHSLTASYSGDSANAPSVSTVLTQAVGLQTTTTTLVSSPNPSFLDGTVTFTATVSPASATGTVAFNNGSVTLGTASLKSGTAQLAILIDGPGTLSVTASYSGDAVNAPSTSAVLTQTVTTPANFPTISGVANAASPAGAIASGTWIAIYGNNLCTATGLVPVNGSSLTTTYAGTSVLIAGKLAYLYYVSSSQLDVLVPADGITGAVSVQVTTTVGMSAPFSIVQAPLAPTLFSFSPQNGKYVAAEDAVTYGLLGPVGLLNAGYPTQPAVPGEIVTVFATGLGQTNPPYADGQIVPSPLALASNLTLVVGVTPASVQGAVLVSPGFYQINFVVPQLPPGDAEIGVAVGTGANLSPSGLFLAIQ
jgi:uncharacterized protein (TIGR03437 family)